MVFLIKKQNKRSYVCFTVLCIKKILNKDFEFILLFTVTPPSNLHTETLVRKSSWCTVHLRHTGIQGHVEQSPHHLRRHLQGGEGLKEKHIEDIVKRKSERRNGGGLRGVEVLEEELDHLAGDGADTITPADHRVGVEKGTNQEVRRMEGNAKEARQGG